MPAEGLGLIGGGFDNYLWVILMQLREADLIFPDHTGKLRVGGMPEDLSPFHLEMLRTIKPGASNTEPYFSKKCPLLGRTVHGLTSQGLWFTFPGLSVPGLRWIASVSAIAIGLGYIAMYVAFLANGLGVSRIFFPDIDDPMQFWIVVPMFLIQSITFGNAIKGVKREVDRSVFGKVSDNYFGIHGSQSPLARMHLERLRLGVHQDPITNTALYGKEYVSTVDPEFAAAAQECIDGIYSAQKSREQD